MKNILLSAFVIFAACPGVAQSEAIQEALTYLNRVRANPDAFSEEIGVPLHNAIPRHALKWDSRLGAAAQRKAEDMAREIARMEAGLTDTDVQPRLYCTNPTDEDFIFEQYGGD